MNKILFLIVLFGLGSAAGIGMLTNNFEVIVQKLGVFHTGDVTLAGCFDSVTQALVTFGTYPLCPSSPPPPPQT